MELKFEVQAKIKRPISDVFDAVYNPNKLSGYFTTGGASNKQSKIKKLFSNGPIQKEEVRK